MVRSLVKFGMQVSDDEDLRFYFERGPADPADRARWEWVDRVLGGWSHDLERPLRSFFETGLLSFAYDSTTALAEYDRTHPTPPMPDGGAAYLEWVEAERHKEPFAPWLRRLYAREAEGSETGQDRLLLQQIEDEMRLKLQDLVRRYEGRKAYVMFEIAKKEREEERQRAAADEGGRSRGERSAPPQNVGRGRPRRYGELPPEPVVIHRRRPT